MKRTMVDNMGQIEIEKALKCSCGNKTAWVIYTGDHTVITWCKMCGALSVKVDNIVQVEEETISGKSLRGLQELKLDLMAILDRINIAD